MNPIVVIINLLQIYRPSIALCITTGCGVQTLDRAAKADMIVPVTNISVVKSPIMQNFLVICILLSDLNKYYARLQTSLFILNVGVYYVLNTWKRRLK